MPQIPCMAAFTGVKLPRSPLARRGKIQGPHWREEVLTFAYSFLWHYMKIFLRCLSNKKPICRRDSRPYCLIAPLGVTWRHRSRDLIPHMGGPLEQSFCLKPFSRYCALSILGSRVWPFVVMWRHRSRDHLIANMPFPIGGPLETSLYL